MSQKQEQFLSEKVLTGGGVTLVMLTSGRAFGVKNLPIGGRKVSLR